MWIISFLCVLGMTMPPAFATGSVTLAWNPSTSPDITGYDVYYGVASGVYDNEISAGDNTNITISNLVEGVTYYFAATAHDDGQSPFSNEISYTVPLNPSNSLAILASPASFNGQFSFTVSGINGRLYVVEASADLTHWAPMMTNTAPFVFTANDMNQHGQQFYRAVLY